MARPVMLGFACGRKEAIAALERFGDRFCCYGGKTWRERHCDCKYGGPDFSRGERTGCPELRTLVLVLEQMTDEEWASHVAKGGALLTSWNEPAPQEPAE